MDKTEYTAFKSFGSANFNKVFDYFEMSLIGLGFDTNFTNQFTILRFDSD